MGPLVLNIPVDCCHDNQNGCDRIGCCYKSENCCRGNSLTLTRYIYILIIFFSKPRWGLLSQRVRILFLFLENHWLTALIASTACGDRMAVLDVVPMGGFATILWRREPATATPKNYRRVKWPATKLKMWRTRIDDHVNINSYVFDMFAGKFTATI